jgi:hypothetical protein
MIFHTAETHFRTDPEAVKLNQPDVYKMHIQFLRPCNVTETSITVKPVKLGPLVSIFQVELSQKNKVRCLGIVTAGNFDKSKGPSIKSDVTVHPPPITKPDFEVVKANKPDENWVTFTYTGEVIPITRRLFILAPKNGYTIEGIADGWYRLNDNLESFHPTFLALMADIMSSMSDTLLHNGTLYDGNNNIRRANEYLATNPDSHPARLENTLAWAQSTTTFSYTATLDVEFRRKVPEGKDGLEWLFVRTTTDGCRDGRMYVENMLYDEEMECVCATRQLILVLESSRKFTKGKKEKASL